MLGMGLPPTLARQIDVRLPQPLTLGQHGMSRWSRERAADSGFGSASGAFTILNSKFAIQVGWLDRS